jgi:hypothetical protein
MLIIKSKAETAPIIPPMKDTTEDIFCTDLVKTIESADLAM